MTYKSHYDSVHFDVNDLIFHGKIEFIRALVSYEASDAVGIKKAFGSAVEDYLALCKSEHIRPITNTN